MSEFGSKCGMLTMFTGRKKSTCGRATPWHTRWSQRPRRTRGAGTSETVHGQGISSQTRHRAQTPPRQGLLGPAKRLAGSGGDNGRLDPPPLQRPHDALGCALSSDQGSRRTEKARGRSVNLCPLIATAGWADKGSNGWDVRKHHPCLCRARPLNLDSLFCFKGGFRCDHTVWSMTT